MSPVSSYIADLNSSDNLGREAAQIPARVGVVSTARNFYWAGPFRAISPENGDVAATVLYTSIFLLDATADYIWNTADPWDTQALAIADTLWSLAGIASLIDPTWCQAVSWPGLGQCWENDTVVPVWSQAYPGGILIHTGSNGPAHIRETAQSDAWINDALMTYAHVPPRSDPPPPDPPPPSTKFTIGDRVETTTSVSVRASAGTAGAIVGTQVVGAQGTVAEGPVGADGIVWWRINFDAGADGWVDEDLLKHVEVPPPPPPPPPPSPEDDNKLSPGEALYVNDYVNSKDGRFRLRYQPDGNLVLYRVQDVFALWASHTAGTSPGVALMQTDGNLVIYDGDSTPIWDTNTHQNPGAYLAVQNDGNVVIYSASGTALWSTHTCCQ